MHVSPQHCYCSVQPIEMWHVSSHYQVMILASHLRCGEVDLGVAKLDLRHTCFYHPSLCLMDVQYIVTLRNMVAFQYRHNVSSYNETTGKISGLPEESGQPHS